MKQKLFLIATVFCSIITSAQIKVYTPGTSTSTSKSDSDNSYKWVVKTDLLGYVSGEFPIAFEYRVAPKLSVEASAGMTYSFFPNESIFGNDEESGIGTYLDTKASLGSAFRGAVKFYPSSDYDAIEGWFFGLQGFNKVTNREYILDSYNDGQYAGFDGKKDSKTKTGVSLIIGRQIFQDSNIAFESFIGIGYASVKRTFYTSVADYTDPDNTVYSTLKNESNDGVPNIQLGFKLGFGN